MENTLSYNDLNENEKQMYHSYEEKRKPCPKCGKSDEVVYVEYGMPTNELSKIARTGVVKLGGCCVTVESMHYYCKRCNENFNNVNK